MLEFRDIFWWEYIHRVLGRLIGFVAVVPLLWLWFCGYLSTWWKYRLVGMVFLGGLQGVVGYWMVKSGFADRIDVAPERLLVHFLLALCILVYIGLLLKKEWCGRVCGVRRVGRGAKFVVGLTVCWLFFLVLSGVLVAGLDGGLVYNTWPKMGDRWIAEDYGFLARDFWGLFVDDMVSAQVHHRFLAYGSLFLVLWQAYVLRGEEGRFVFFGSRILVLLILCQMVLGIGTLLSGLDFVLALLHQLGAISIFLLGVFIGVEVYFFEDVSGEVE
jgi:cytochrome c oxidase assembly protein subunit 15